MDSNLSNETSGSPTLVTSFAELGIAGALTEAIAALGWTAPTEIQALAIPHSLEGRDIIGLAETGRRPPPCVSLFFKKKIFLFRVCVVRVCRRLW